MKVVIKGKKISLKNLSPVQVNIQRKLLLYSLKEDDTLLNSLEKKQLSLLIQLKEIQKLIEKKEIEFEKSYSLLTKLIEYHGDEKEKKFYQQWEKFKEIQNY